MTRSVEASASRVAIAEDFGMAAEPVQFRVTRLCELHGDPDGRDRGTIYLQVEVSQGKAYGGTLTGFFPPDIHAYIMRVLNVQVERS